MAKRVAVIGAGPSGLAAARHFGAPDSPFECQVFEQDGDLGGTWRFSEHVGTDQSGRPVHSSMYKDLRFYFIVFYSFYLFGYFLLRTNLPKDIMSYPDFPFDKNLGTFLSAEEVLEYLEEYANLHNLRRLIKVLFSLSCFNDIMKIKFKILQFNHSVEEVRPQQNSTKWNVKTLDLQTGNETNEVYDAVIVANGYDRIFFPSYYFTT
jgi:cation diffusion facilitator CzcD-associated flavoprotein CzcO